MKKLFYSGVAFTCIVDYNCLLFFICLCFFSACKEEQEDSTVEVIKITLLEKSNIYIPADSIFESAGIP